MKTSKNRNRIRIVAVLLGAAALAIFALGYWPMNHEQIEIRQRYAAMQAALASGDTKAATSLLTPSIQAEAQSRLSMIERFGAPLGWRSRVRVSGATASIIPAVSFLPRWPLQGHAIAMIKIDGQWLFTGDVHID